MTRTTLQQKSLEELRELLNLPTDPGSDIDNLETDQGLFGADAIVVASDAPAQVLAAAQMLAVLYPDRVYYCDGTADEVQINLANTALQATGGILRLTAGTFYLAAAVAFGGATQLAPSILLVGAGYSTKITQGTEANLAYLVRTTGGVEGTFVNSRISMRDLCIDGNKANNSGSTVGVDWCCYQSSIVNVRITNCDSHGIVPRGISSAQNGVDNRYINCEVSANAGRGMSWGSYSPDAIIIGCKVYENGSNGIMFTGGDIFLEASSVYSNGDSEVLINNNVWGQIIGNWIGGTKTCLYLQSGTALSTSRLQIIGNSIYNSSATPTAYPLIRCYSANASYPVSHVSIIGNNLWSATGGAKYAWYFTETSDITVMGNTVGGTYATSIYAETGNNVGNVWLGNIGYIAPGEIRTAYKALTGGIQNAIALAWENPELQAVWVRKVCPNVSTPGGTGGSLLDVGVADDAAGTNRGTEFFNDLDLNTAKLNDSWLGTDGGQQTKWVKLEANGNATDSFIVGQILAANASALAGGAYVEYCGAA